MSNIPTGYGWMNVSLNEMVFIVTRKHMLIPVARLLDDITLPSPMDHSDEAHADTTPNIYPYTAAMDPDAPLPSFWICAPDTAA